MRRDVLTHLLTALDDLRSYIIASESMSRISRVEIMSLQGNNAELVKAAQTSMLSPAKSAQFLYSTVIVGLYGQLEQYAERLVQEFVQQLAGLAARYIELPPRLLDNHRRLSHIFADQVENNRGSDTTTVPDIVANLHSCLSGSETFIVNSRAFSYHTANLRVPIVERMFSEAGGPNTTQEIIRDPRFRAVVDSIDPDSADVFFRVNDLADRRNEIAHGAPSELLSPALLEQYIAIVEAFCRSLFEAVVLSTMPYAETAFATRIGSPYRILGSGRIACFEVPAGANIRINDTIVAKSGNDPIRSGAIGSLQVDGIDQKHVHAETVQRVGVGLDFRCKETWSYWLLPG